MKILLVYPGQVCSTYDVALGYHEILNRLHAVYPYYLHDWIEYHQGALNYWRAVNPDFSYSPVEVDKIWQRLSGGLLIESVVEHDPDVIVIIHGLLLHPHTYMLLNRFDIPKVVILTECPYIDGEQKRLLETAKFDHIFVNDRASLDAFEGNVTYLPHSYSRLRHRPGRPDATYATDVYFHGTLFDERAALFASLDFNGHKAHIKGVQLDQKSELVPNAQLVKYYQNTKIALNNHRPSGKGQSLGPRAYEIAACNAFQLCDDTRPELYEVFGDTVATYADAQELQDKIEYYLNHDAERREMARAALERVTPCSFYDRAHELVLPVLEGL